MYYGLLSLAGGEDFGLKVKWVLPYRDPYRNGNCLQSFKQFFDASGGGGEAVLAADLSTVRKTAGEPALRIDLIMAFLQHELDLAVFEIQHVELLSRLLAQPLQIK